MIVSLETVTDFVGPRLVVCHDNVVRLSALCVVTQPSGEANWCCFEPHAFLRVLSRNEASEGASSRR